MTVTDIDRTVLATLTLPDHPLLVASTSRAEDWLDYETADGFPADFCVEWIDDVATETGTSQRHIDHGPDVEISQERRYTFGRFAELAAVVQKVIDRRSRNTEAPIELEISEWSLHYRSAA